MPAGAGAKVAAVRLLFGIPRGREGKRENRHLTAAFPEDELDIPPGLSGSTALWDTGGKKRARGRAPGPDGRPSL